MPTNLPQRQDKTFMVPFLWAVVCVPVVYGIAAYSFISYERSQLEADRAHGRTSLISLSGLRWNDR